MNKKGRNVVSKAVEQLEATKASLEDLFEEETDKIENYPENLQETEAFEAIEEAANTLEEAVQGLESVIECLDSFS